MIAPTDMRTTLDRIVRRERGRILAGLVARLGAARLDLAEDVAQDAVLEALTAWSYKGLPENPAAWLARVARNKAVDRLRRAGFETSADGFIRDGCLIASIKNDEWRVKSHRCGH